ncbi:hypothetical protein LCGC14_2325420 [marine sediment metagenome]|uniref:Uncharacterized protein n=1 Tax=marine sediment metagenome TaxID=412755 RepID=A0A0F9CGK3_9ZZZZ
MHTPIQTLCKSDDYVNQELSQARILMGLKTTDLDRLADVVGLLYIHCSDKLQTITLATLDEIHLRAAYKVCLSF